MERYFDESIPLAKYPTCSWTSDAYTNWLTQNGINVATQMISGSIASAGMLATGNLAGSAGTIVGTIANTIGQFYSASLLPAITGGQNTGDVNFSSLNNTFVFHHMRAKTEYLKIIDDFFSMYGYKVNSLKIPNITGRQNWNYVKTLNANILGNIPQDAIQELKAIFDNGVTFWHNANTFLDYSQQNNII